MNEESKHPETREIKGEKGKPRKPYVKPAFVFEKAFETMALSCGKITNTSGPCHANRKTS